MNQRKMVGHVARVAVLGFLVGCSAIVDAEIAPGGIGAQCKSSSECQGGVCNPSGLCVSLCNSNADCPATTECFASQCQKPLKVGAMWVGVSSGGEGWTLTHEEGIQFAASKLPYMTWIKKENIVTPDEVNAAIDDFVAQGVNVVVANSFSQREATLAKAEQYPNVKFLVAQAYKTNGRNADTFAAHGEQGWWVAGKVAGQKTRDSDTHRLGYIGSFITPEVVRHIAAFYLGAKSVDPQAKLEVQWMGFWSDLNSTAQFEYVAPPGAPDAGRKTTYYYEQYLTRLLIDHGAVVIGHGADNQRSVKLIEDLKIPNIWSISNDNPNAYKALVPQPDGQSLPTGAPLASCLGSPYWNWGPLYADMFDQIHRGTWVPNSRNDAMSTDTANAVVGFNLNPTVGIDEPAVRGFLTDIATRGWQAIYTGPYATSGQRDKEDDGTIDPDQTVAAGASIDDKEYERMCWFPEGIVERVPSDSTDPSTERQARVPDEVFNSDPVWAAKRAEMERAAFPGLPMVCNKNR